MKKLIVLPLLFLAACQGSNNVHEVTASTDDTHVVGGLGVPYANELTNKALSLRVGYKNKDNSDFTVYQCTASALSRKVILTAAHCLGSSADYTQIELRDSNGTIIPVKVVKAYIHPGYEKDKDDDLSLMVLQKELPLNVYILHLPNVLLGEELKQVQVAGYGRKTGVRGQPGDLGVLRATNLNVLNFDFNKKIFSVDQTQGKGICQGDSGGPALVKRFNLDYVVGIVSKTRFNIPEEENKPVDQCNFRGEYVNLQYRPFRNWTEQMLKLLTTNNNIPAELAKSYDLK